MQYCYRFVKLDGMDGDYYLQAASCRDSRFAFIGADCVWETGFSFSWHAIQPDDVPAKVRHALLAKLQDWLEAHALSESL